MWSDLHFGDHTRTLGLSHARICPSFLRDVAQKSDEVLSQKSGDQFDHDRHDVTWMMVKRLGSLQMAEELTRVVVSYNYHIPSIPIISKWYHYIHIIITYHLSPLYHGYQSWYPNDTTIFCGSNSLLAMVFQSLAPSWLANVSKLCTTGNTGSWGCFFFKKKVEVN